MSLLLLVVAVLLLRSLFASGLLGTADLLRGLFDTSTALYSIDLLLPDLALAHLRNASVLVAHLLRDSIPVRL